MKKLLTELIGTFFLVFTVGMTVITPGAGTWTPLAIGLALMIMVYAGGHISGGHYNPAVTLGVWVRGKIPGREVPGYMLAQFVGAFMASLLTLFLKGYPTLPSMIVNPAIAVIAEAVGTFALVYVVLNTATAKTTAGNSNYGLAIGMTVTAMAYSVGYLSGGAFNPAVALGLSVLNASAWINLWVYLVGNFAGAILAACVFLYCNSEKTSISQSQNQNQKKNSPTPTKTY